MGALKMQLKSDLTAALKAQDAFAKSSLRMALAAIQTAEVAGQQARELTDAEELAVLTKEVNKRKDSAETYAQAGREELAAKERGEADFLSEYLPTALTDAELDALVAEEVATAAAELGDRPAMKQMGTIVRAVNTRAAGRADGSTVAARVKAALQG